MKFFLKKRQPKARASLTLYLTEETAEEFIPTKPGRKLETETSQNDMVDYGKRLRYSSNILATTVCCLLVGMCYLQWQTPPQVLQYEQNPEQPSLDQPLAVDVENEGLFASMTIEVCDYDSLEQAHLLVNGEIAGTFHHKQLVVRVYPGDTLEIDTTAYLNPCRFQVTKKSSHLRTETIENGITTENGYGWIGKVSFK